jgi:hypothetical protein
MNDSIDKLHRAISKLIVGKTMQPDRGGRQTCPWTSGSPWPESLLSKRQ